MSISPLSLLGIISIYAYLFASAVSALTGDTETMSLESGPEQYALAVSITVPPPLVLDCGDISETADPSAQIADWLAMASVTSTCDPDPELESDFNISSLNICAPASYVITVTWSATDACGSTGIAASTITVIPDTQDPSITVPSPLVLDCGDMSETADPSAQILDWLASASASDNCDTDPELEYDFNLSQLNICAPAAYAITVTWTATDACNNNTSNVQTITVIPDTEKPSITVPSPLVLDCGDMSETADPSAQILDWLATASASDNCDTDPELVYDFNLSQLNICASASYMITVTWTATDACNNNTSKVQTITVIPDTEKPSITVPAPLVLDCGDINETADPSGQVLDWLATASASDNCDTDPELVYDFNLSQLNICAPASYTINVTWTATDACNNNTSKVQTITVIPDTEKPSITVPTPLVLDCGDISETADPSAQVLDWLASASASDNCDTDPELGYDFNMSALNICAPAAYTITVTWTATDACNNNTSKVQTITVIPDTEKPSITVPAPLDLDCNDFDDMGDLTLQMLAWLSQATASDNCDTDPELVYDIDLGGLDVCTPGIYGISVTWTATDACNNNTSKVSTISAEICAPVNPLTIICPGDFYRQNDIDWCQARIEPDTPVIITCSNFVDASLVLTWTITGAGATDVNGVPVTDGIGFLPPLYYNVGISIVEYFATGVDNVGNPLADSCSFTITVVDKQKPELAGGFPVDEWVNCNAVPDPFPLTVVDFIDNCPGPLLLAFIEMSTQGANPSLCDYYTYEITRIWKVTDVAGNMRPFEQNIFVVDTTAPEFTVNDVLISCEFVDLAPGIIDTSDNCAANEYLTIDFVDVSTQDPNMENCGHYTYIIYRTWTVTDPCGNATTKLQVITVQDVEPPVIECQDITVELDENGEYVLSGNDVLTYVEDNCAADEFLIVTVITQSGPLTCEDLGTSLHTIMVTDPCDNAAFCTVNITVVDLLAPTIICPAPQTFYLSGGECVQYLIPDNLPVAEDNCNVTISYSPPIDDGIRVGSHTIIATATDESGNTASCAFVIIVIAHDPQSNVLTCNDQIQISLGPTCEAEVNADMILEGDNYGCYDDYCIYIIDDEGDTLENNTFTLDHINQCFAVSIQDCANSNNSCWGIICVEEKINPEITCPADITVACTQNIETDVTGIPEVLSCELSITMDYEDAISDNGDCGDPRLLIDRTWIVTDESGNESTCVQHITVEKFNPLILEFPDDIIAYSCFEVSENPNLLLPAYSGIPTLNGEPIFGDHYCEVFVGYWDETAIDANCPTNYTILRHWLVLDQCLPYEEGVNPVRHVQLIQVLDDEQPDIYCPDDMVVSTDPWFCYATVNLPPPVIEDACSQLVSYTVHSSSGNLIHYGGSWYALTNLGVGTHTVTYVTKDQCNNIGYCHFTITVVDDVPPVPLCDEHTVVTLTSDDPLDEGLTKLYATTLDDGSYDNCGPVTFLARRMLSCIDFDWIGPNGEYPNNDGGQPESQDGGLTFQEWVPFACCDVGQTIMVELRVTDQYGNINSCMVEVNVQDKLPPLIICPPDITVSCDFWFDAHETDGFQPTDGLESVFGRVLDAYEFHEDDRGYIYIDDPGSPLPQPYYWGRDGWADDNCNVDIDVRTRLFDDCSGNDLPGGAPQWAVRLVERTFRAQDGQGNTSTCRQRIWVVDYDPFYIEDTQCGLVNADDVRWPCDLLLTDCPQGELTPENLNGYAPNNRPVVYDDNCSIIGVTYEDQIFYFIENACYKIVRTWTVIDWCQYESDGEGGHYGYWTYVQVIKVHDEDGAEFLDCPDGPLTYCVEDPNVELPSNNQVFLGESNPNSSACSVHVWESRTVYETCSDHVIYDVKIYPYNHEEYVQIVDKTTVAVDSNGQAILTWDTRQNSLPSNHPIRRYGLPYNDRLCSNWPFAGGEKDYHRVLWSVEDGCGNLSTCEYLFRLEDCKKPTPICVGLSSVVMPSSGSVTIWAADFDSGSSVDDCTSHDYLLFSFSGTTYQPSRVFDCDAVAANGSPSFLVEIWVADEGNDLNCSGRTLPLVGVLDTTGIQYNERNKDFCTTFIVIDDNEGVCGDSLTGGVVETEEFESVEKVNVKLTDQNGQVMNTYVTDKDGLYHFINPLFDYTIEPARNDNHKNGVSTLDLVTIQKHLLGLQPLNSPYKMIAADANNSESVSALDLVEIRKLILGLYTEFPKNTSWRFVDGSFEFADPNHPWPFDEMIESHSGMTMQEDFVGVKVGDVNGTVTANASQITTRGARNILKLQVEDREVQVGETIQVPVTSENYESMFGYQFTMNLNGLNYVGIEAGTIAMQPEFVGVHKSAITMSWGVTEVMTVGKDEVLFTLQFTATAAGSLKDMLDINSEITEAEAYTSVGDKIELLDVTLVFGTTGVENALEYALYQNEPNPFADQTVIGFDLPEAMPATLTLYDMSGKVIRVVEGDYAKGYNEVILKRKDLVADGAYYYHLQAGDFTASKKMILSK